MRKFLSVLSILIPVVLVLLSLDSTVCQFQFQPVLGTTPRKPFGFLVPPSKDFDSNSGKKKNPDGKFSANNINPKGFDFSKVTKSQAFPVKNNYKPVIPLLWVDLPLFDTPVFSVNRKINNNPTNRKTFREGKRVEVHKVPVHNQNHKPHQQVPINSKAASRSFPVGEKTPVPIPIRTTATATIATATEKDGKAFQRTDVAKSSSGSAKPAKPNQAINSGLLFAESKNQVQRKVSIFQPPSFQNHAVGFKPTASFPKSPRTAEPGPNHQSGRSKPKDLSTLPLEGSNYNFKYSVSHAETQDVKSHMENRIGNIVQGEYSILEPDGYTRVVKYFADASGFKATVKRIPPASQAH